MDKGKKTTRVAYVALVLIIALFVALFMKIITADDLWNGITAVGAGAIVFIGFLSKDQTASHTFDKNAGGGELPPDDEKIQPPPPPGG